MANLSLNSKIYVAGHRGLIGSHLVETLQSRGYEKIITRAREDLNLLDRNAVLQFFADERPDVVFLAAAKVGGIAANNTYRADFIHENILIQENVIWSSHAHEVGRLIFLGSSCIYPKAAAQPMSESCLLTGPLEYTNRPYAIAKIAGIELINALRTQFKRDYFSVMPTNLYGPRDNFHPYNSHVLPALIRKFCDAKDLMQDEVTVWGTGKPLREFMYASDCADAIVFLAENLDWARLEQASLASEGWYHINVGSGQEISIFDLASLVAKAVGFEGNIIFDSSMPDGTMRKLLNIEFLKSMGWKPRVNLEDGIRKTVDWYLNNNPVLT